jgi:nucleoside phosphorylase
MIAIVFPTPDDAALLTDVSPGARLDDLEEGTPIQIDETVVAVTGLGKIKATLATERLLQTHDVEALIHLGPCVGLDETLEPGTLVGASFVLEGDRVELDAPTYPRMPLECPFDVDAEGTLVSQDRPGGGDEPSYWERLADVRDETSYPVAYVAAQHGTPCHVVKVVDDAPPTRLDALHPLLASLLADGLPTG